jgi:hypothetical protein
MSEPEKPLTEAEKQIRRLEALRTKKEDVSKASAEKTYFPAKTGVERTIDKLRALKSEAERPAKPVRRGKIEGKQKSAKLTYLQLKVIEQILSQDKRLKGSRIIRIALNRLLGLDHTGEETEMETRIHEILRKFKNRS